MATVEPSEIVVERRAGWMRRLVDWASQSADRRMLTLWVGWTTLSWTLLVLASFLGSQTVASGISSVVIHSTVFALVAAAAFVKPLTLRSVLGPLILYLVWCVSAALIGVIQIALLDSAIPFFIYDIGASFVSSLGSWLWLGVNFYLVSQLLRICVTRQPGEVYEVFTVWKLMAATLCAATAFALLQIESSQEIWVAPDTAKLFHVLSTSLVAMIWGIVLWTQICSRQVALLLIILTAVTGVGVSKLLHVTVWAQMELKQGTLSQPSLMASAFSWLMSMLGVWIALRIARAGGYRVKRISTGRPTNAQLES